MIDLRHGIWNAAETVGPCRVCDISCSYDLRRKSRLANIITGCTFSQRSKFNIMINEADILKTVSNLKLQEKFSLLKLPPQKKRQCQSHNIYVALNKCKIKKAHSIHQKLLPDG